MALPTLQPYYVTKANATRPEKVIVRRRNYQDDFKQKWSQTSQYFRQTNVGASKENSWTSSKAVEESLGAYHDIINKEQKKRRLQERKQELQKLLEDERVQLLEEMKELKLGPQGQLSQMKEKAEELKSARERERKEIAHEKLYHHWRENNPQIRKMEAKQFEKSVHDTWSHQREEKSKKLESELEEKARYEELAEQERIEAFKRERVEAERKHREEKRHAEVLQLQMAEIKRREEEAAMMEQERAMLVKEQVELERIEKERSQLETERKRTELGRVLLRQAKAQLRRKSQQIQEDLEQDLQLLENLAMREREDQALQTSRKMKAKADAEWMRQVVAEQIQLEREREAELDVIYQEEAVRLWRKRELEWEKEREARERLMKEVLGERQKQIDRKMEVLQAKQAESIERREDLLREIELSRQQTAREQDKRTDMVSARAQELKQQVLEKKRQAALARQQYEKELEDQRRMEEEYDNLVQVEEEAITTRGYQPKSYRIQERLKMQSGEESSSSGRLNPVGRLQQSEESVQRTA